MGSLLQRGEHFGYGVMYRWTNVSHGNASEADSSSPPPIRLQDWSMALLNVAILKLLVMAPANFISSIAHQIGGVRQLWIAQITPDIIPEIW